MNEKNISKTIALIFCDVKRIILKYRFNLTEIITLAWKQKK